MFYTYYLSTRLRNKYIQSSYGYFEGHSSSIVPEHIALLKPNFNKAPPVVHLV